MKKPLLIGLIGEMGSGKQTFVSLLRKVVSPLTVDHFETSQVLKEELDRQNIQASRKNLQDLALEKGKPWLLSQMKNKIDNSTADIVIFDTVRMWEDYEFTKYLGAIFVYIVADQKIRYQRRLKAAEKVGESSMTWDQFLTLSQRPTEIDMPEIGKKADFMLTNNGTKAEFKKNIKDLSNQLIKD